MGGRLRRIWDREGVGVLRLRQAMRFAHDLAPLRMTGGGAGAEFTQPVKPYTLKTTGEQIRPSV